MNNEVLIYGAAIAGGAVAVLAIGAAFDRAKKAWNKRFPEITRRIEENRSVTALGACINLLSAGYILGKMHAPIDNWEKLANVGLVVGFSLMYHDKIMMAWAAMKEVVFDRKKKPNDEPFSAPELKTLRDENKRDFAALKKRVDVLKHDRYPN